MAPSQTSAAFPMRRVLLPIVTIAVLFAPVPTSADDLLLDRFRDYLEALRTQAGIPGLSVSVIWYNATAWERAFGKQDNERSITTRPDTPFELDGTTQVFTSAIVLRCLEEGQLSLDDPIGKFSPGSPDAKVTIRQALSHTSDDQVFRYRPDRVEALTPVIAACTGSSFVETFARRLASFAMVDSVPGSNVVQTGSGLERDPDQLDAGPVSLGSFAACLAVRRRRTRNRLSIPLCRNDVDAGERADLDGARHRAVRAGSEKRTDCQAGDAGDGVGPGVGAGGQLLPHGLGWFVQSYNGETIVWQFGVSQGASSSLIVTVPGRGLTLILIANSDGLSWPFSLARGDLTASPFGRLFLGLFVR